MAEAEAFGDPGDGGFYAVGRSGDLQHELMLLGMQGGLGSGLLAEVEELAESVAEFGEGLEALAVWGGVHGCLYISYHDVFLGDYARNMRWLEDY
jgi:hypothetical protein